MNVKNLFIYDVDEYKKFINLINNVFKTFVDLPKIFLGIATITFYLKNLIGQ